MRRFLPIFLTLLLCYFATLSLVKANHQCGQDCDHFSESERDFLGRPACDHGCQGDMNATNQAEKDAGGAQEYSQQADSPTSVQAVTQQLAVQVAQAQQAAETKADTAVAKPERSGCISGDCCIFSGDCSHLGSNYYCSPSNPDLNIWGYCTEGDNKARDGDDILADLSKNIPLSELYDTSLSTIYTQEISAYRQSGKNIDEINQEIKDFLTKKTEEKFKPVLEERKTELKRVFDTVSSANDDEIIQECQLSKNKCDCGGAIADISACLLGESSANAMINYGATRENQVVIANLAGQCQKIAPGSPDCQNPTKAQEIILSEINRGLLLDQEHCQYCQGQDQVNLASARIIEKLFPNVELANLTRAVELFKISKLKITGSDSNPDQAYLNAARISGETATTLKEILGESVSTQTLIGVVSHQMKSQAEAINYSLAAKKLPTIPDQERVVELAAEYGLSTDATKQLVETGKQYAEDVKAAKLAAESEQRVMSAAMNLLNTPNTPSQQILGNLKVEEQERARKLSDNIENTQQDYLECRNDNCEDKLKPLTQLGLSNEYLNALKDQRNRLIAQQAYTNYQEAVAKPDYDLRLGNNRSIIEVFRPTDENKPAQQNFDQFNKDSTLLRLLTPQQYASSLDRNKELIDYCNDNGICNPGNSFDPDTASDIYLVRNLLTDQIANLELRTELKNQNDYLSSHNYYEEDLFAKDFINTLSKKVLVSESDTSEITQQCISTNTLQTTTIIKKVNNRPTPITSHRSENCEFGCTNGGCLEKSELPAKFQEFILLAADQSDSHFSTILEENSNRLSTECVTSGTAGTGLIESCNTNQIASQARQNTLIQTRQEALFAISDCLGQTSDCLSKYDRSQWGAYHDLHQEFTGSPIITVQHETVLADLRAGKVDPLEIQATLDTMKQDPGYNLVYNLNQSTFGFAGLAYTANNENLDDYKEIVQKATVQNVSDLGSIPQIYISKLAIAADDKIPGEGNWFLNTSLVTANVFRSTILLPWTLTEMATNAVFDREKPDSLSAINNSYTGNAIMGGAIPAGYAVGVAAIVALPTALSLAGTFTYLSTAFGVYGTINSLPQTTYSCAFQPRFETTFDGGACALAAGNTAYMALTTLTGVLAGANPANVLDDLAQSGVKNAVTTATAESIDDATRALTNAKVANATMSKLELLIQGSSTATGLIGIPLFGSQAIQTCGDMINGTPGSNPWSCLSNAGMALASMGRITSVGLSLFRTPSSVLTPLGQLSGYAGEAGDVFDGVSSCIGNAVFNIGQCFQGVIDVLLDKADMVGGHRVNTQLTADLSGKYQTALDNYTSQINYPTSESDLRSAINEMADWRTHIQIALDSTAGRTNTPAVRAINEIRPKFNQDSYSDVALVANLLELQLLARLEQQLGFSDVDEGLTLNSRDYYNRLLASVSAIGRGTRNPDVLKAINEATEKLTELAAKNAEVAPAAGSPEAAAPFVAQATALTETAEALTTESVKESPAKKLARLVTGGPPTMPVSLPSKSTTPTDTTAPVLAPATTETNQFERLGLPTISPTSIVTIDNGSDTPISPLDQELFIASLHTLPDGQIITVDGNKYIKRENGSFQPILSEASPNRTRFQFLATSVGQTLVNSNPLLGLLFNNTLELALPGHLAVEPPQKPPAPPAPPAAPAAPAPATAVEEFQNWLARTFTTNPNFTQPAERAPIVPILPIMLNTGDWSRDSTIAYNKNLSIDELLEQRQYRVDDLVNPLYTEGDKQVFGDILALIDYELALRKAAVVPPTAAATAKLAVTSLIENIFDNENLVTPPVTIITPSPNEVAKFVNLWANRIFLGSTGAVSEFIGKQVENLQAKLAKPTPSAPTPTVNTKFESEMRLNVGPHAPYHLIRVFFNGDGKIVAVSQEKHGETSSLNAVFINDKLMGPDQPYLVNDRDEIMIAYDNKTEKFIVFGDEFIGENGVPRAESKYIIGLYPLPTKSSIPAPNTPSNFRIGLADVGGTVSPLFPPIAHLLATNPQFISQVNWYWNNRGLLVKQLTSKPDPLRDLFNEFQKNNPQGIKAGNIFQKSGSYYRATENSKGKLSLIRVLPLKVELPGYQSSIGTYVKKNNPSTIQLANNFDVSLWWNEDNTQLKLKPADSNQEYVLTDKPIFFTNGLKILLGPNNTLQVDWYTNEIKLDSGQSIRITPEGNLLFVNQAFVVGDKSRTPNFQINGNFYGRQETQIPIQINDYIITNRGKQVSLVLGQNGYYQLINNGSTTAKREQTTKFTLSYTSRFATEVETRENFLKYVSSYLGLAIDITEIREKSADYKIYVGYLKSLLGLSYDPDLKHREYLWVSGNPRYDSAVDDAKVNFLLFHYFNDSFPEFANFIKDNFTRFPEHTLDRLRFSQNSLRHLGQQEQGFTTLAEITYLKNLEKLITLYESYTTLSHEQFLSRVQQTLSDFDPQLQQKVFELLNAQQSYSPFDKNTYSDQLLNTYPYTPYMYNDTILSFVEGEISEFLSQRLFKQITDESGIDAFTQHKTNIQAFWNQAFVEVGLEKPSWFEPYLYDKKEDYDYLWQHATAENTLANAAGLFFLRQTLGQSQENFETLLNHEATHQTYLPQGNLRKDIGELFIHNEILTELLAQMITNQSFSIPNINSGFSSYQSGVNELINILKVVDQNFGNGYAFKQLLQGISDYGNNIVDHPLVHIAKAYSQIDGRSENEFYQRLSSFTDNILRNDLTNLPEDAQYVGQDNNETLQNGDEGNIIPSSSKPAESGGGEGAARNVASFDIKKIWNDIKTNWQWRGQKTNQTQPMALNLEETIFPQNIEIINPDNTKTNISIDKKQLLGTIMSMGSALPLENSKLHLITDNRTFIFRNGAWHEMTLYYHYTSDTGVIGIATDQMIKRGERKALTLNQPGDVYLTTIKPENMKVFADNPFLFFFGHIQMYFNQETVGLPASRATNYFEVFALPDDLKQTLLTSEVVFSENLDFKDPRFYVNPVAKPRINTSIPTSQPLSPTSFLQSLQDGDIVRIEGKDYIVSEENSTLLNIIEKLPNGVVIIVTNSHDKVINYHIDDGEVISGQSKEMGGGSVGGNNTSDPDAVTRTELTNIFLELKEKIYKLGENGNKEMGPFLQQIKNVGYDPLEIAVRVAEEIKYSFPQLSRQILDFIDEKRRPVPVPAPGENKSAILNPQTIRGENGEGAFYVVNINKAKYDYRKPQPLTTRRGMASIINDNSTGFSGGWTKFFKKYLEPNNVSEGGVIIGPNIYSALRGTHGLAFFAATGGNYTSKNRVPEFSVDYTPDYGVVVLTFRIENLPSGEQYYIPSSPEQLINIINLYKPDIVMQENKAKTPVYDSNGNFVNFLGEKSPTLPILLAPMGLIANPIFAPLGLLTAPYILRDAIAPLIPSPAFQQFANRLAAAADNIYNPRNWPRAWTDMKIAVEETASNTPCALGYDQTPQKTILADGSLTDLRTNVATSRLSKGSVSEEIDIVKSVDPRGVAPLPPSLTNATPHWRGPTPPISISNIFDWFVPSVSAAGSKAPCGTFNISDPKLSDVGTFEKRNDGLYFAGTKITPEGILVTAVTGDQVKLSLSSPNKIRVDNQPDRNWLNWQWPGIRANINSSDLMANIKKNNIPVPSQNYYINEEKASNWINSFSGQDKEIAKLIILNISHITFTQFLESLAQTVSSLNSSLVNKRYVILVNSLDLNENKSTSWIYDIVKPFLPPGGEIVKTTDIQNWIRKNPNVKDFVVLDDASYSAIQLKQKIGFVNQLKLTSPTVHISIPFMTNYSISQVLNDYKFPIVFHGNQKIESFQEIIDRSNINSEVKRRIYELYSVYQRNVLSLLFFDHKMPDQSSTALPFEGELGLMTQDGLPINKLILVPNIPFIQNITPPYKKSTPIFPILLAPMGGILGMANPLGLITSPVVLPILLIQSTNQLLQQNWPDLPISKALDNVANFRFRSIVRDIKDNLDPNSLGNLFDLSQVDLSKTNIKFTLSVFSNGKNTKEQVIDHFKQHPLRLTIGENDKLQLINPNDADYLALAQEENVSLADIQVIVMGISYTTQDIFSDPTASGFQITMVGDKIPTNHTGIDQEIIDQTRDLPPGTEIVILADGNVLAKYQKVGDDSWTKIDHSAETGGGGDPISTAIEMLSSPEVQTFLTTNQRLINFGVTAGFFLYDAAGVPGQLVRSFIRRVVISEFLWGTQRVENITDRGWTIGQTGSTSIPGSQGGRIDVPVYTVTSMSGDTFEFVPSRQTLADPDFSVGGTLQPHHSITPRSKYVENYPSVTTALLKRSLQTTLTRFALVVGFSEMVGGASGTIISPLINMVLMPQSIVANTLTNLIAQAMVQPLKEVYNFTRFMYLLPSIIRSNTGSPGFAQLREWVVAQLNEIKIFSNSKTFSYQITTPDNPLPITHRGLVDRNIIKQTLALPLGTEITILDDRNSVVRKFIKNETGNWVRLDPQAETGGGFTDLAVPLPNAKTDKIKLETLKRLFPGGEVNYREVPWQGWENELDMFTQTLEPNELLSAKRHLGNILRFIKPKNLLKTGLDFTPSLVAAHLSVTDIWGIVRGSGTAARSGRSLEASLKLIFALMPFTPTTTTHQFTDKWMAFRMAIMARESVSIAFPENWQTVVIQPERKPNISFSFPISGLNTRLGEIIDLLLQEGTIVKVTLQNGNISNYTVQNGKLKSQSYLTNPQNTEYLLGQYEAYLKAQGRADVAQAVQALRQDLQTRGNTVETWQKHIPHLASFIANVQGGVPIALPEKRLLYVVGIGSDVRNPILSAPDANEYILLSGSEDFNMINGGKIYSAEDAQQHLKNLQDLGIIQNLNSNITPFQTPQTPVAVFRFTLDGNPKRVLFYKSSLMFTDSSQLTQPLGTESLPDFIATRFGFVYEDAPLIFGTESFYDTYSLPMYLKLHLQTSLTDNANIISKYQNITQVVSPQFYLDKYVKLPTHSSASQVTTGQLVTDPGTRIMRVSLSNQNPQPPTYTNGIFTGTLDSKKYQPLLDKFNTAHQQIINTGEKQILEIGYSENPEYDRDMNQLWEIKKSEFLNKLDVDEKEIESQAIEALDYIVQYRGKVNSATPVWIRRLMTVLNYLESRIPDIQSNLSPALSSIKIVIISNALASKALTRVIDQSHPYFQTATDHLNQILGKSGYPNDVFQPLREEDVVIAPLGKGVAAIYKQGLDYIAIDVPSLTDEDSSTLFHENVHRIQTQHDWTKKVTWKVTDSKKRTALVEGLTLMMEKEAWMTNGHGDQLPNLTYSYQFYLDMVDIGFRGRLRNLGKTEDQINGLFAAGATIDPHGLANILGNGDIDLGWKYIDDMTGYVVQEIENHKTKPETDIRHSSRLNTDKIELSPILESALETSLFARGSLANQFGFIIDSLPFVKLDIDESGNVIRELGWRISKNTHFKEGFSLESITNSKDIFIEVAGPTENGFVFIKPDQVSKAFISNIHRGVKTYDEDTGKFLGYYGQVDFQTSSLSLPFADQYLGGIFTSCLPVCIRPPSLAEDYRALKPGGYLIWEGASDEDLKNAANLGFTIDAYYYHSYLSGRWWSVVFQKPTP